jgi:hypothetical protein
VDRYLKDGVNQTFRSDHIGLFFREESMLGAEESLELAREMIGNEEAGGAKFPAAVYMCHRSRVSQKSKMLSPEDQRGIGKESLNTGLDLSHNVSGTQ